MKPHFIMLHKNKSVNYEKVNKHNTRHHQIDTYDVKGSLFTTSSAVLRRKDVYVMQS